MDATPVSSAPRKNVGAKPNDRNRARRMRDEPFRQGALTLEERSALLRWLDDGLRRGNAGRLEAEFPTTLSSGDMTAVLANHIVIRCDGQFASHAMARTIPVTARGIEIKLGMIGMVYTDPAFRGQGAATLALEGAIARLKDCGANLAILWSDLDAFYGRSGFHRGGIENVYLLNEDLCRRARSRDLANLQVRRAVASDWPHLETLYASKSSRHLRSPGELAQLAGAPECDTRVALADGRAVAYASMGRGDDLTGVVHEWAGAPEGVIEILNTFATKQSEFMLLEGPQQEAATESLRSCGVRPNPGTLGLMRILDAGHLFRVITQGHETLADMTLVPCPHHASAYTFSTATREFTLSHQSALSLFFGPTLPRTLQLGVESHEREALSSRFPLPLFIWGFDSI